MAVEVVNHTSLTGHSSPFQPSGGTSYSCDVQGTIVNGGVELQMLQNGSFVPLNPPIKFTPFNVGGTKVTGFIPNLTVLRWTVPLGCNVTTKIVSTHN